jgi:hypothetical protein
MIRYNTFLLLFIVSVIAFLTFMGFYLKGVFSFVLQAQDNPHPNPFEMFTTIFSPPVVIGLILLVVTSLAIRIMGVVAVAKSKTVTDNEKIFWIIGFVLMSFITAIVFLIMARKKGFVE